MARVSGDPTPAAGHRHRTLPAPPPEGVPHLPTLPTGRVRWSTAATTAALAGLLVLASYAGPALLTAAVVLVVLAVAIGWAPLLALPSPRGTTAVVAVTGTLCAVAVGLTTREPLLQWLAPALAAGVLAEFVHQLGRRDGRPRMVESSTGVLAAVCVLASLSSLVALPRSHSGVSSGVLVAVGPVALALVLQLLPLPARHASAAGLVVAVLAGGLLGGPLPAVTPVAVAAVAALSSAVALVLHRLLSVQPAAGWAPGWLALAAAPLASSGMVSYVVLRVLVG